MNKFDKEKFKEFLDRDDLKYGDLVFNDDCEKVINMVFETTHNINIFRQLLSDKEINELFIDIAHSRFVTDLKIDGDENDLKSGVEFFKKCIYYLEKLEYYDGDEY